MVFTDTPVYMTRNSTARLVHAFDTSTLDSCNFLLFGLPERELKKVQRVQKFALRSSSPSIGYQCMQIALYKILLIIFKALDSMAPIFISDLLSLYKPIRVLRSSSDYRLRVINSSTNVYGKRSYVSAFANAWNNLPSCIRLASSLGIFKS